jgi:GT2 family glycosyltransferase
MKFSLIICTYQRPKAIITLLKSVEKQVLYPNEIIIVDGSLDNLTELALSDANFKNLNYFKVDSANRGLTKQRNFGISKVAEDCEIVCFLDDDVLLEPEYFEQLLNTYKIYPNAIGVGGYISNEICWYKKNKILKYDEYEIDGFVRKLGRRNVIRKRLGLLSDKLPGIMPEFSNGLTTSFLPPSNRIYRLEHFMGGVSSFRKEIFDKIQFSMFFEGYGLYEDLDFCLKASKLGKLYVNTAAKLEHHHESLGRPNSYKYGKMVVRNGWYVWRVKYSNPTFKSKLLFHLNVILLLKLRFINSFYGTNKKDAFYEAIGRLVGWFSLFLKKPKKY